MGTDTHREIDEEARDRIALYVLDSMRGVETSRFEEHLALCAACREEVARLKPVVADLVLVGPRSDPPPGLKQRVLERARQPSFGLRPVARRSWYTTEVPGVEFSLLWTEAATGRHTILIRMEAGASIPMHRNPGPEECFVVSGDLRDGDLELGAGDYVRHDDGAEHSISTREGCQLFVTTYTPEEQTQSSPSR